MSDELSTPSNPPAGSDTLSAETPPPPLSNPPAGSDTLSAETPPPPLSNPPAGSDTLSAETPPPPLSSLSLPRSDNSDKKGTSFLLGKQSSTKKPPTSHQDPKKTSTNADQPFSETETPEDEERPFKYLSTKQLKERRKLIEKRIDDLLAQEHELADQIREINEDLAKMSFGDQRRKEQRNLRKLELDRANLEEERKGLEKELQEIAKELERRETEKTESNTDLEVSIQEIYRQGELADDAIINTILYTATFFAELPPKDFKEVVAEFLKGRNGKIQNVAPSKPKSDKDTDEPVPTFTQVNLYKYWQESFSQSNRFLEACYLKSKRESETLVLDFTLPYLRENLTQYFQEDHPFFFDEQLERVEILLFHPSKKVADQATQLLAEAATYQGVNWLLEIAGKAPETEYFFDRIANLIYQIQLRLEPSQSGRLLIPFFKTLLSVSQENAFATILRLLYRHLQSQLSFNISNAATQLLGWLREIVDDGDKSQKVNAYSVLWLLLNQRDTDTYLYDLLELLYTWLPEPGLSLEDYQESHKVALVLFFRYCQETLSAVRIEDYGKWPPEYILFKPLYNNSARLSKLNMLVSWLFYQGDRQRLALEAVLDEIPSETESSSLGLEIGFIVLEWFAILYGLKKEQNPNSKATEFARDLLKQITLVTDRSAQRQILEWWTELSDRFLDAAELYDQQDQPSLRRQFSARRVLVKELKSTFKALQQEAQ